MRIGVIENLITGERIKVHATTDHPMSHYGRAVWVDDDNEAILEVDCPVPNPFYRVVEDSGSI